MACRTWLIVAELHQPPKRSNAYSRKLNATASELCGMRRKEATARQVCVLEDHGGAGPSRTNRGTHPDRHRCGQQQNNERVRPGVAGLSQHWKDDQIALLGTAPDCQLARNLKKSASVISQKRDRLGIPPFTPFEWSDEKIALLGTTSDREVGTRLGIIASCVQSRREQLGIPSLVVRWTRAEIALLGSDTDRNIAKLLGRSEIAIKVNRNKHNPAHPRI
jgi:hypothetical protein